MSSKQKWTEERVDALVEIIGANAGVEITADAQYDAASQLEVSVRSIAAKLRNMEYAVASTAAAVKAQYTDAEEEEIRAFVESNAGVFTYAEIAEQVLDGSRTAKQIQGKLLSMELFGSVKPAPKVEVAKQYTDSEEAVIMEAMANGDFLEDIVDKVGHGIRSVRGKCLSIHKANPELTIPKQRESHAVTKADVLGELGDVSEMTVADIAAKTEKTERGIKTMLTRRGITAKDYDGAKKAAKNAAASAE